MRRTPGDPEGMASSERASNGLPSARCPRLGGFPPEHPLTREVLARQARSEKHAASPERVFDAACRWDGGAP